MFQRAHLEGYRCCPSYQVDTLHLHLQFVHDSNRALRDYLDRQYQALLRRHRPLRSVICFELFATLEIALGVTVDYSHFNRLQYC